MITNGQVMAPLLLSLCCLVRKMENDMLKIRLFTFNSFGESTLVCYEPGGSCIIIDPGCTTNKEQQLLKTFIEEENLSPQAVVNTHGHIDHILGVEYCMKTWGIGFFLHKGDVPVVRTAPGYAGVFG